MKNKEKSTNASLWDMTLEKEHEILEMLLNCLVLDRDCKRLAKILLGHFGSLHRTLNASATALSAIPELGETIPKKLAFLRTVANTYWSGGLAKEFSENSKKIRQTCIPWIKQLAGQNEEKLEVAYLDDYYSILPNGIECIVSEKLDGVQVFYSEILKPILRRNCKRIVICRNCPNGNCMPTEHDERMLNMLETSLITLSINVLDYFIVSGPSAYSLKWQRCEFKKIWSNSTK
ncbi:MAG: hypothetical protein LBI69_02225 [Puniceicoccales bacterium]|jgi:DNA repair protein RadC|nr:hypothetical protein [Puniceicoccales bacterium]